MNQFHRFNRYSAAIALTGAIVTILTGCAIPGRDSQLQDRASAPACPDSNSPADARPVSASLPLGCINRANLRAMVADLRDLDQGQALEPASGVQEARAVEAYKKGTVKRLNTESGTGSSTMTAQTTQQAQ